MGLWTVSVSMELWTVSVSGVGRIADCPDSGLASVRWREARGLPPDGGSTLDHRDTWTDRAVCEACGQASLDLRLSSGADDGLGVDHRVTLTAEIARGLLAREAAAVVETYRLCADRDGRVAAARAAQQSAADAELLRAMPHATREQIRAASIEAVGEYERRVASYRARQELEAEAARVRGEQDRAEKLTRLAPVVAAHGTEVQRRKFAAGLMAVGEAVEVLRAATEARMAAAGYASVEEDRPVRAPDVAHDEDDCQGEIEYTGDEPVQALPDAQFVRAEAVRTVVPDGATVEYRAYTERCMGCGGTARVWYARLRYTEIGFSFIRDVSLMP